MLNYLVTPVCRNCQLKWIRWFKQNMKHAVFEFCIYSYIVQRLQYHGPVWTYIRMDVTNSNWEQMAWPRSISCGICSCWQMVLSTTIQPNRSMSWILFPGKLFRNSFFLQWPIKLNLDKYHFGKHPHVDKRCSVIKYEPNHGFLDALTLIFKVKFEHKTVVFEI